MTEPRLGTELKRQVAERARGCCEYCRSQVRFAMQSFAIGHIEPAPEGDRDAPENLALACQGCKEQT